MKRFSGLENDQNQLRNWLVFLLPSFTGFLLFVVPFRCDQGIVIPVALLAGCLKLLLKESITAIITSIVVLTGLITIITKAFQPRWIMKNTFLSALFDISLFWSMARVTGVIFILFCYFQMGPEAFRSETTGGMVLNHLLPTLFSVFIIAGLLLPLLMSFGLLELLGVLMTKIMRPLFNLPGHSAINCITSWLGDGSVGILMTIKQYESSIYTHREAAVISTTFSIVSITFTLVVIAQVGLEHIFTQFYLTICCAGFIAAIIVPRLPPLSRKQDQFICGKRRNKDDEDIPEGSTAFSWGLEQALKKAAGIANPLKIILDGGKNAVDMTFGVLPVVMCIGTVALMIAEYTPCFQYLGMPFLPLLEWLRIPEARATSTAMMVGFTDMFVPSILAASINNDMSRFVIAALSLTQLIYLSEVGALLLGSKIPITLFELFIIFILKTLVTLPVIAAIAHLIF